MKNKKIAILLVITLVLMQIMPTYAATATGSNADAATPSNADEIIMGSDEFSEKLETLKSYSSVPVASASNADYGIMLLSDGDSGYVLPDSYSAVTATVALDKIKVELKYRDKDGLLKSVYDQCSEDGRFDIDLPSDFSEFYCFCIWFDNITPASGQYLMTQSLTGRGVCDWSVRDIFIWSSKYRENVKTEIVSFPLDFADFGGKFMSFANIALGRDISWCLNVYFTDFDSSDFPFSGFCKISFEKFLDFDAGDLDSTAGSYTSTDAAIDTADNTGQIASNTASIDDTLKELIKHISDQLAALWDQMYNLMHVPQLANDDKNTQSIIDTLTNGLSVEVENNDDNTEEIIHGYDQSGIDDANDSLNSSITEYSEAEKDVLDSVNENLNDFEFEESFDAYVSTIGTVSDFLQRMYESSGALKDVINIGFFLSIAGIVVGLYRFKEG